MLGKKSYVTVPGELLVRNVRATSSVEKPADGRVTGAKGLEIVVAAGGPRSVRGRVLFQEIVVHQGEGLSALRADKRLGP